MANIDEFLRTRNGWTDTITTEFYNSSLYATYSPSYDEVEYCWKTENPYPISQFEEYHPIKKRKRKTSPKVVQDEELQVADVEELERFLMGNDR